MTHQVEKRTSKPAQAEMIRELIKQVKMNLFLLVDFMNQQK